MFRNKHIIVALLVAPLLALLAWFAVGGFLGEKAAPAQPGQSYPLVARSNCRYASGRCDLENNDLTLSLQFDAELGGTLVLSATHALDSVLLSIGAPGGEYAPRRMRPSAGDGLTWRLQLGSRPAPDQQLRLVAAASGASYFVETATAFLAVEE